jgi:16S rRNA (uracil1498-N3)-methyltransferase
MQYLYIDKAKEPIVTLSGDEHRYIFKVRRHRVDEIISLRNLQDGLIYHYKITHIDKKTAILELQDSKILTIKASRYLHIGWCVIDTKNIEKTLPSLNEIGVFKISFIYCKRSQKSFKIDLKRFEKILLNSSQQSGRSAMMELEIVDSLDKFVALYPDAKMLNFSKENLIQKDSADTIVVGCEGGFSKDEVAMFGSDKIVGFDTSLILKSESAVCAVSSKILL